MGMQVKVLVGVQDITVIAEDDMSLKAVLFDILYQGIVRPADIAFTLETAVIYPSPKSPEFIAAEVKETLHDKGYNVI